MAGTKKIALYGLSRVSLFPVTQNDASGYAVGEKIDLPWISEMTREVDASETKVYGDDRLYANIVSWNGLTTTMTLLEMPLSVHETLGFGTYDAETETLKWDPQGKNLEFAVAFRCQMIGGGYRMYKMFAFTANELKDSGMRTKGDGQQVNSYQLVGTFTRRLYDDEICDIHDGEDMTWLDTVDAAPVTATP